MAKNKKPTRKYTPRPIRPPVTKGLFDDLSRDLHFALMALEHGGVTEGNWKRVAKVLMTVSFATDNDPRLDRADKIAVDSAVLTVKALSDVQVRTGKWYATSFDLVALKRGVTAADRLIPLLDYRRLKDGYLALTSAMQLIK